MSYISYLNINFIILINSVDHLNKQMIFFNMTKHTSSFRTSACHLIIIFILIWWENNHNASILNKKMREDGKVWTDLIMISTKKRYTRMNTVHGYLYWIAEILSLEHWIFLLLASLIWNIMALLLIIHNMLIQMHINT